MISCDRQDSLKKSMPSKVDQGVVLEYVERGIVSPRQIKEIRATYELSRRETEDLVCHLVAQGVCLLDDNNLERIYEVQKSIFYQNRRRCNCLLNRMPLHRLVSAFLVLPDTGEFIDVSAFRSLPSWRQYVRELSRLQMVTAGEQGSEVRLSEGFRGIQRAVHTYLDEGYVAGLRHSWRKEARANPTELAKKVCQSAFFPIVVLPVVREYYLSLPEVKTFISWIRGCSTQPPSMYEIVRHAMDGDELREVWWLLLAGSHSSSSAAIEDGSDVCFGCLKISECTPRFPGQYDRQAVSDLLRRYQDEITADFLDELEKGDSIEQLIPRLSGDRMLLKFAVDCNVVNSSKGFLESLEILDSTCDVLRKDAGAYCPLNDLWLLRSEFAERQT